MECKLSVVIPVYNRAGIVSRTLDSVSAQTLRPLRVILVDNNSTDGSVTVLDEWRRRESAPNFAVDIIAEKEPGAAAARNAGLARVTTPWVMFFDSDDIMDPDHCRRAMGAADDSADIIGWDVDIALKSGRRTGTFVRGASHFDNIFRGGMATLRWCARTETVRLAGGWNPKALIWDDIELGARLIAAGARIKGLTGAPTAHTGYTADSISFAPAAEKAGRIRTVLALIEESLPAGKRHYVDFKRVLAAGEMLRESGGAGVSGEAVRQLYTEALMRAGSAWHRVLMRMCFNYIRRYPRGAVPFLSVFVK